MRPYIIISLIACLVYLVGMFTGDVRQMVPSVLTAIIDGYFFVVIYSLYGRMRDSQTSKINNSKKSKYIVNV